MGVPSGSRADNVVPFPGRPERPERPERREPLWREAVGDVLREERHGAGRTLADVADEAGVSVQYLSEVERGRKEPSSMVLAAICRALGLDVVDLLVAAQPELARWRSPRLLSPRRRHPRCLTHDAHVHLL